MAIGERDHARVGAVKTDKAFQALATAMLKEIGTSHLSVSAPSMSAGTGVGLRLEELGGERIVRGHRNAVASP
jgi:hypothetical protein